MRRRFSLLGMTALAVAAVASLSLVGVAGAKQPGKPKKNPKATRPVQSPTPVFKLRMKPQREVPRLRNDGSKAKGHVTFDLTRNSKGEITSGDVIFYLNYRFPESVTFTGLHVHEGRKGTNGDVVINSGVGGEVDADGAGNITVEVKNVLKETLQSILNNPRRYYVNLRTEKHPSGALRDQFRRPKKF